jgi:hypothetical protein
MAVNLEAQLRELNGTQGLNTIYQQISMKNKIS